MQTDRVVVITGAGGGIGSLLVDRFLAHGDAVVATDAVPAGLQRLAERHDRDGRLLTHLADITSEDDVRGLAEVVGNEFGRVDVLINCAGYFPFMPFEDVTPEFWRRIIDINLTGAFITTHAFLPLMKDRGWGRIVNFSSGSVYDGARALGHYVAAKAGIVGFSRSLARELGGYGITVNAITPGLTVTSAVREAVPEEILAEQRQRRAIVRDEEPQDLVGPVFFLASPDADFITGQTLNVDGGSSMV